MGKLKIKYIWTIYDIAYMMEMSYKGSHKIGGYYIVEI